MNTGLLIVTVFSVVHNVTPLKREMVSYVGTLCYIVDCSVNLKLF